jgi:hypothetical protein
MSDIGWISIHRKITGHWVWEGKPYSYGQAWIDILLECNHKERKALIKKKLVTAKRGQSLNSLKTWADRWGWSIRSVRTFFELLKNDMMIDTHSVGVTTRLTVLNYDTYQTERHARDTQNDTHETRTRHAGDTQATTNNNVNNENNANNDILRTHKAYRDISTRKPTQHEYMQLTQLVYQYKADQVITAIIEMGDNGWHSISSLQKILKGELNTKKEKDTSDYPQDRKLPSVLQ